MTMADPELQWRDEIYRQLAKSGSVDIGAIYPPREPGRLWRWRVWVTESGTAAKGTELREDAARRRVEERFQGFLAAAGLAPKSQRN
ncbi:hypothetical protein PPF1_89 [Rhizobium phage vB_RleM_PPF1]|uniref:hypothetical protein n=1 Tax=Rhizobium phage vB_RleM_PPF1 TaxID=1498228 RepID=UPI000499CC21|nr:hypothetical protein PPF1_89 [Rhizobium phage vB_RleM_PPF1]AID18402.1 hypothetical protein PPF1_89 [Rhizobium phage vB_RleM_PPF1]